MHTTAAHDPRPDGSDGADAGLPCVVLGDPWKVAAVAAALHATALHLLGLDHQRLTYRFQGRDFRLTDVHGELVTKLFA